MEQGDQAVSRQGKTPFQKAYNLGVQPRDWEPNWKKKTRRAVLLRASKWNVGCNPHSCCHSPLTFSFQSCKGIPCEVQVLVSPFAPQSTNKEVWRRETFVETWEEEPSASIGQILCTVVVLSFILLVCVLGEQGQYLILLCILRFPRRSVIIC